MKKTLRTVAIATALSLTFSITAFADQSARWVGSGDTWKVSDNNGGYLMNSWFQDDVTGDWYMLGADGVMYAGLITDQSTGKSYLLNTNHDGTYGRMLSADGTYNVNGKNIYLTFNQNHDGTFGAILTGLSDVKGAGITETSLASIPTDSAGGTTENTASQDKSFQDLVNSWKISSYDDVLKSNGYDPNGNYQSGINRNDPDVKAADENFLKNR